MPDVLLQPDQCSGIFDFSPEDNFDDPIHILDRMYAYPTDEFRQWVFDSLSYNVEYATNLGYYSSGICANDEDWSKYLVRITFGSPADRILFMLRWIGG